MKHITRAFCRRSSQRVAQVLLVGRLLHNVQVYRPPQQQPDEVNDTVCTIEQLQDLRRGDDWQEDRQPLPHDGALAWNLGRTPRRPVIVLVVPPLQSLEKLAQGSLEPSRPLTPIHFVQQGVSTGPL